jgi:hypothetical protein
VLVAPAYAGASRVLARLYRSRALLRLGGVLRGERQAVLALRFT